MHRTWVFVIGWLSFLFMGYMAWERRLSFARGYDPYEVLGIPYGSGEEEIRKQYRLLSLKFHPDRVAEDEKEAAEARFVDISKAYKALTDEDIRRNYEETGNPDGIRNMTLGIALPSWLVEQDNNLVVLAIYAIIFGLGLPFIVARWWYHSKAYSKANIHFKTMGLFYKELCEGISPTQLIEVMCAATEFQELIIWDSKDTKLIPELFARVKSTFEAVHNGEKLEKNKKFTAPYTHKSFVLLMAYIYRVPIDDSNLVIAQERVILTCFRLVDGMAQIAVAKDWVDVLINLIKFSQLLVQAVHSSVYHFLQLPYINYEVSDELSKVQLADGKRCRVPKDLLTLPKNKLVDIVKSGGDVSSDELDTAVDNILSVARRIPKICLVKPMIQVVGQDKITPGSLITAAFFLCLTFSDEEEQLVKEKDSFQFVNLESIVNINFKSGKLDVGKNFSPVSDEVLVHAPFFPSEKIGSWTAILSIGPPPNMPDNTKARRSFVSTPQKIQKIPIGNNYLLKKSSDSILPPAVLFQFPAPSEPGPLFLALDLRSDSWLNSDFHCDIKINVADTPLEDLAPEGNGYDGMESYDSE